MTAISFLTAGVLVFFCAGIALLVAIYFLEIICACYKKSPTKVNIHQDVDTQISATIVIPAHNEAKTITNTLRGLKEKLSANDNILVVADNCTDQTAQLAKLEDVCVIERTSKTKLGKGFALDFAINALRKAPPEVVIVLDADCEVESKSLDKLKLLAFKNSRPIQCLNLMYAKDGASAGIKIAQFAFKVKNYVRPLGMKTLGLPCHLTGTGMAFSWELINQSNLANGDLVEDMKLGIDFVLKGAGPLFCDDVQIRSYFSNKSSATKSQRTRWEHGHMLTIRKYVPSMILSSIKSRSLAQFFFALDLAIPPLSLLLLSVTLSVFLSLFGLIFNLNILLYLSCFSLFAFLSSNLLAWYFFGRNIISPRQFISLIHYIFGKLDVYFSFLFKRQKKWIRTERD